MILKRPELIVCLAQQAQFGITFKVRFSWGKWVSGHFRGGLQSSERPVNRCLCFAFEASKVQMVPAAEKALDLQDPWVVGRCEGLPVCVWGGGEGEGGDTAPHLKAHSALQVPIAGSRARPGAQGSSPCPAAGSRRAQPLAGTSSGPGRARAPRRGAGGASGGGGGPRSSSHIWRGWERSPLFPPGFVLTAVSIPPVTPRVIPDR